MPGENPKSILSYSYVVDILIFMATHDDLICSDLSVIVSNLDRRKTVYRRIVDAGLADYSVDMRPRKVYHLFLTEAGQQVAAKLLAADSIARGLSPEPDKNVSVLTSTGSCEQEQS